MRLVKRDHQVENISTTENNLNKIVTNKPLIHYYRFTLGKQQQAGYFAIKLSSQ